MALDPKTARRIINEESAAFLDSNFAPLDHRGLTPDWTATAPEEFEVADKHGFNRVQTDTRGSLLRQFVQNPDLESLRDLGAATKDPNIAYDVMDQVSEQNAAEFRRLNPDYSSKNSDALWRSLALSGGMTNADEADGNDCILFCVSNNLCTVENLQMVWDGLKQRGIAELPEGSFRNLSDAEKLQIQLLCTVPERAQLFQAVHEYVRLSLSKPRARFDLEAIISHPAYRDLIERAIWDCWCWNVPDFDATSLEDFEQFAVAYVGNRPLNVGLLDTAWRAFRERQRSVFRERIVAGEAPSENQADFDDLDDTALSNLYTRVRKEHSKTARPGLLS
jgi:hypothetical protein